MIGQLVQRRGRPLHHRLDKLPQALHSLAPPRLQLAGVFRQVRAKLFSINVCTARKQKARVCGERKIAMAAQLGICSVGRDSSALIRSFSGVIAASTKSPITGARDLTRPSISARRWGETFASIARRSSGVGTFVIYTCLMLGAFPWRRS